MQPLLLINSSVGACCMPCGVALETRIVRCNVFPAYSGAPWRINVCKQFGQWRRRIPPIACCAQAQNRSAEKQTLRFARLCVSSASNAADIPTGRQRHRRCALDPGQCMRKHKPMPNACGWQSQLSTVTLPEWLRGWT